MVRGFLLGLFFLWGGMPAWATKADVLGQPVPWQTGFQSPSSPVMREIETVHTTISWILAFIAIGVVSLVIFVCIRFREKQDRLPSTVSHHTALEIIWTVIPCLLLIVIAIPSFRLLYYMDRVPPAAMTIKVVGHQWYWSYEYPDYGNFSFDSMIIPDRELKPGEPRLLAVNNPMVVPVGKVVRIITTSDDVIHSWAVPSLGVKRDTVPGRINETWFKIEHEGMYYGQCSELCGSQHGFMPIGIKAVSENVFHQWVQEAQKKWGGS